MGLAWRQGPLAAGSIGRFLTAQPMCFADFSDPDGNTWVLQERDNRHE